MRWAVIFLLILTFGISSAGEFLETFDGADGTFPECLTWTGDPRGAGVFETQDGALAHISGGYVYYFRDADTTACGTYEFDVFGSYWEFTWRITPFDPAQGHCIRLCHNDFWGQWGYTLSEFSWWTPGEYPEGQYMWANGSYGDIAHYWTTGPLDGWCHVSIADGLVPTEVRVDGELIFAEHVGAPWGGFVGLGASAGGSVMTPQFDNLSFTYHSAVESTSWGRVKTLFR